MTLDARVAAALARIHNPRLDNDLLSAGMIRDLAVTPEGRVSFTFLLAREDPATLVREARKALQAIDGVSEVKINVMDPAGPSKVTHGPPGAPQSVGAVPAPSPQEMPNLGRVIAVSSGKGGVGKSTVAVNLAVALAQRGLRLGIMDADIYGPNVPRMFGLFERPPVIKGRIQPLEAFGVRLISLGLIVDRDAPAIWRGPIIMKVIQQFLRDVEWGQLDYLIVDMPPGTGDAQLSLVQSTPVSGAVIVTTPQEMAVGDALRGAKMFERVNVPVLGIVENMSGFTDPATGQRWEFFGSGGGQRLADELGVPLLGRVPLQPDLAALADRGQPVLTAAPDSPAAQALLRIAGEVVNQVSAKGLVLPVLNN
ncbi:MAG TPA: Mrp/NBP35 family ATP-binding protein [Gemmatimonadales bacterium]